MVRSPARNIGRGLQAGGRRRGQICRAPGWCGSRSKSHQGPPGRRRPGTTVGPDCHRGPGRRRTGLRSGHVPHPRAARRPGQAPDTAVGRARGPGLLLTRHPVPSATTRDPRGHSAAVRPGRPPPVARSSRRPPARLRRRGPQPAEHRRTLHQPAQAVARPGHPMRQARHRDPHPDHAREPVPAGTGSRTCCAQRSVRAASPESLAGGSTKVAGALKQ